MNIAKLQSYNLNDTACYISDDVYISAVFSEKYDIIVCEHGTSRDLIFQIFAICNSALFLEDVAERKRHEEEQKRIEKEKPEAEQKNRFGLKEKDKNSAMKDYHVHFGQYEETYYNGSEIADIVMSSGIEALSFLSITYCVDTVYPMQNVRFALILSSGRNNFILRSGVKVWLGFW